MGPAGIPLTPAVIATSWTPDITTIVLTVVLGAGYLRCRRTVDLPASGFLTGVLLWMLAGTSVIAVYAPVLFWMRALQVLLLLFVVPFLLALGRPVLTLRAALGDTGRARLDGMLTSRTAQVLLSPVTTSAVMLGVPWLLYLSPWYTASMTGPIAAVTRIVLVIAGFGYYYTRLQVDEVPHRYPPALSIGISVLETLGDGVLGLVLWLGPLIAYPYYAGLERHWGPDMRLDQTVGAGILWILGDVIGLPFLLLLLRSMSTHDRRRARDIDDDLDRHAIDEQPSASGLWWENDPQLSDRLRRS